MNQLTSAIADDMLDIRDYAEVKHLGRGAFSDVFLYELRPEHRDKGNAVPLVAIKMPRRDHGGYERKLGSRFIEAEAEFLRELHRDKSVSDLIVLYYPTRPDPMTGEPYLALEPLVEETGWHNLSVFVSRLSTSVVIAVLGKTVRLQEALLKKGIVNSDFKLDSLFIRGESPFVVKVIDFNTATRGVQDDPEWPKVRRAFEVLIKELTSSIRYPNGEGNRSFADFLVKLCLLRFDLANKRKNLEGSNVAAYALDQLEEFWKILVDDVPSASPEDKQRDLQSYLEEFSLMFGPDTAPEWQQLERDDKWGAVVRQLYELNDVAKLSSGLLDLASWVGQS